MSDSTGAADPLVRYDVATGVATITLDSPPNRNALSGRLMAGLEDALERAGDDDSVRVIVLSHTGSVFCSGMDLREATGADARAQGVNTFPRILQRIWDSPKPVVVRVGGAARAGGIGLIAVCDIAIASDTAHFALSEVRLGLVPALITVPLLKRVSATALHELALTGEKFDAERAREIGLLNRSVRADQLDAEVARFVQMLVAGGPIALGAVKQTLRRQQPATMAEDYAAMQELSAGYFASAEGQEGIASFTQKRQASWIPS